MTRVHRQGFARAFIAGMIASTCVGLACAADEPNAWHDSSAPNDFAAHAHHQLALPATTACLDAAVASGRASNILSGVAVAVVLDGRVVYRRGFGTIGPASSQAVQPTTRFRIGSITKALTAITVLSLAEDRRIHLHAPVTRLLP